MSNALLAAMYVVGLLSACAGPQTQLGSISQDQVVIEQARQQQFFIQTALKSTFRLQNVANPLLRAAAPFCRDKVRPTAGYVAGNAYLWKGDYFNAALSLGYGDTLVVMNVTPDMGADKAGIKPGDRIIAVNGNRVAIGSRALTDWDSKLPNAKDRTSGTYTLTYRRGDEERTVLVPTEAVCAYTPQVLNSDVVNASADGKTIIIPSGMLRFAADDDELAVVVGHELAHDAMRHLEAKSKNAMFGALLGAIVDVAAATQGVNTQGDFTKQGAELGSIVFSQDFEREADYVGLYILQLAGRPKEAALPFWRKMAAADPKSIKFAYSHPTTAERFVRLDKWIGEIDRKVALGLPLAPEMKKGTAAFAVSPAVVPARTSVPSSPSPSAEAGKVATLSPKSEQPPQASAALKEKSSATTRGPVIKTQKVQTSDALPDEVAATAVIGAPTTEDDRLSAQAAFAEANAYMGSHLWSKAEESFRKTVRLDGSVARYHAGLGSALMILGKWKDAEAEYTAAVLLDLDNENYRGLVKEARAKSLQWNR